MNLDHYLKKENNNFDLLRLILALAVIYGHSEFLNRGSDGLFFDPFMNLYPDTYIGDIAVKIFFFLSGLLLSTSLLRNPSIATYLVSRTFRIIPALIFVLFLTTFIFGPFLSTLSLQEYLSHKQTWTYFVNSSFLKIQYFLPGIYTDLENKSFNGSLWTLPLEFRFYLLLLAFYILTQFQKRAFANLILGIILIDSVLGNQILIKSFGESSIINLLPISFFYGVFLGINSKYISINSQVVFASLLIFVLFRDQPFGQLLFTLCYCTFAFWFSTLPFLSKLKLPIDISYGVYLWGYFFQQLIYSQMGRLNIFVHILLATVASVIMAIITHYLVEKPFINYGKKLSLYLKSKKESFNY